MNHPDSQSQNDISLEDGLLGGSWLEKDLSLCIERYPTTLRPVWEILAPNDYSQFRLWFKSGEQTDLYVSRSTSHTASDWTTDLTLEIIGMIAGVKEANQQHIPIVAHFCEQHADEKTWGRGAIMMQDFINQLQGLLPSEGSHHSSERPQYISEDLADLWDQFKRCVIDT